MSTKDSNRTTLAEPLATALQDTPGLRKGLTRGLPDGVCDPASLDELRAEGDSLLPELVTIFQCELTKGLDQLNRALVARDCAAAARIAHTLKGTAGTFGAACMQEMAARIDQAARAGQADEATAMYDGFRSECERVRRYLAAEVKV